MDYKELGKEVTERYFKRLDDDRGKKVLEEIIRDIAKREELNNEEIARVCQYVNVRVFLRLYKATNDKTTEFEVADPNNIIDVPLEKDEDLSFDESYYTINKEESKEESEEEPIDLDGLKNLAQKLRNERDSLEIKLMEKKPLLLRILSSKLRSEKPNYIVYTAKTAGAPEELLKEASLNAGLDNIPETKELDYLVDTNEGFLQKVARYGKMKSRYDELEEKLEKLGGILTKALKSPFKTMQTASEVKNTLSKSKDIKDKLSDDKDVTDMKSMKKNLKKYKNNSKSKGGYLS